MAKIRVELKRSHFTPHGQELFDELHSSRKSSWIYFACSPIPAVTGAAMTGEALLEATSGRSGGFAGRGNELKCASLGIIGLGVAATSFWFGVRERREIARIGKKNT